jgi:rod shape-determining protein MreB
VSNVHFINKGLASTLGAGFDPEDQRATLVVDIGAGTTTVAAMVHNHLIFTRTLRVGGNDLDTALTSMIKYNHSLLVGPRTAERIKIELGCAVPFEQEQTTMVKGRSIVTGSPEMAIVNTAEIHEAIEPIVSRIIKAIQDALEALPPEASGDIYDRGMVLAGGGALLAGFDERLSKETELAVQLAESPARAVVRGLGVLFESPLMLRKAVVK